MTIKNRDTLKQQYDDYVNRNAPFDGNALIQKTEDLQVTNDDFDSNLMKDDTEASLNSPSSAISLDFESVDLHKINSSGSIDTTFVLTINNLGTGQVARIHITKKNNDTYSFSNAVIGQINNLKQTGTILSFFVHNINGVLVAYSDMTIAKTNSITDSDPEKIATAKAVSDLNSIKADIAQEDWIDLTLQNGAVKNVAAVLTQETPAFFKDTLGMVHLRGNISSGSGASAEIVATLPVGSRPLYEVAMIFERSSAPDVQPRISTNGEINTGRPNAASNLTLDGVIFPTHN